MILYITDRNIRVYNADNQISYNSDYIAEFRFDDEWNGKVKTARFVQNGEHVDVVLVDDRCEIPPLKTGFVRIGVFSDSMTSTYADVYFKTSIKDGSGNPTEPPEDIYAQLTALIESGILKGDDGLTPYVGSNNNWWIGDIDTGVLARGTDGEKGDKGDPFTYEDFTPEQLKNLKGADGYTPVKGVDYFDGEKGDKGDKGDTPVKGVDYFTASEVKQIQNEVSSGAIGDFKAVVDEETATFNTNAENTLTDYNANAQEKFDTYNTNADSKFETYNTNAETKFSVYNTNAEVKLSEYNQNDLDKTTLYNTNADSKFTTYNENAETKFSEYTSNADTKLSEYNQNNSNKTALYNVNAENKLSAYDSNAQAKLDLYNQNDSEKLEAYNSNHTAKVAEYNANAETKTAEFDSNAAALQTEVDRLRGECDTLAAENRKQENRIDALMKLNKGQTYDILPEEGETASRTAPSGAKYVSVDRLGGKSIVWNQELKLDRLTNHNGITASFNDDRSITINGTATDNAYILIDSRNSFKLNENHKYLYKGCPSGGSVTGYFIGDSWSNMGRDYGSGTIFTATSGNFQPRIIVIKGNTVSNLTFKPNLIDLTKMFGAGNEPTAEQFVAMFPAELYPYNPGEIISSRTETITAGAETITTGFPVLNSADSVYDYIDLNEGKLYTWTYVEGNEVKALTEPVITDIIIPTELSDWLTVETGGSVTFHNADETKHLPVPNGVSWVRKLDEVN